MAFFLFAPESLSPAFQASSNDTSPGCVTLKQETCVQHPSLKLFGASLQTHVQVSGQSSCSEMFRC